jgi:PAS domain S-box-containing protein
MSEHDFPPELGQRIFKAASDHAFHSITVTRSANENHPSEIVYVNDAFTEMTGYEPEEVIGETPGILQGPKTEEEVLERLRRRIGAGKIFHGRTINYRRDGSEFLIEWKVVPLGQVVPDDEGGEPASYYVAVQHEVSEEEEG